MCVDSKIDPRRVARLMVRVDSKIDPRRVARLMVCAVVRRFNDRSTQSCTTNGGRRCA